MLLQGSKKHADTVNQQGHIASRMKRDLKRKVAMVTFAGVVGAAIGALAGHGPLLRYRAVGVLSMGLSSGEYKRVTEFANGVSTVSQFLDASPPPGLDARHASSLIAEVAAGRWQEPVPRVSSADAKQLPEALLKWAEEPELGGRERLIYLGVRISTVAAEPLRAAQDAMWLGGYLKEMAAWSAVTDKVSKWTAENRQFSERAQERRLRYQFDIDQAQARAAALKKIVADYPGYSHQAPSQVVDVRKDNEKFVSPMAQLIGAESEVIDVQEKIGSLDREIDQASFSKSLLADFSSTLSAARSGTDSVRRLQEVVQSFSTKARTDAQRERLSAFSADLSEISARFLTRAQFIANPSPPIHPESPKPLLVTILGALLAMLLSVAWQWRSALFASLAWYEETESIPGCP